MHVPEAVDTLLSSGVPRVPFHQDGAGLRALGLEDEFGYLDDAGVPFLSHLEDGDGVVDVLEGVAVCENQRPHFSHDAGVHWYIDRLRDDVCAMIEEDDFSGVGVQDGLDCGGVISDSVALGTFILHRDEVGDVEVLVLWTGALKDGLLSVGEEGDWLRKCAV